MRLETTRAWFVLALCAFATNCVDNCQSQEAAESVETTTSLAAMRETILPRWSDVASSENARSIATSAIARYWNGLEVDDLEAFVLQLSPKSKRDRAQQAIEQLYDAAATCLRKSTSLSSMQHAVFEFLMLKVEKCIARDAPIPSLIIATTNGSSAVVTDVVAIAITPAPVVTQAPTSEPTSATPPSTPIFATSAPVIATPASVFVTPAPEFTTPTTAIETTAPAIETPSPSVAPFVSNAPPLEPSSAVPQLPSIAPLQQTTTDTVKSVLAPEAIRPALGRIPAMSLLDADGSGVVAMAEWDAYVESLKTVAHKRVASIKDTRSKALLDTIVVFHYIMLRSCIEQSVQLSATQDFAQLVAAIDAHCYVKFRYSLFAGMPPFEFIARSAAAVAPVQVVEWFAAQLAIARSDMRSSKRALGLPLASLTRLEATVACVAVALQPARDAQMLTMVDKATYHRMLAQAEQCSAKRIQ